MRTLPTRIEATSLLLVEGPDDQRVFEALLRARQREGIQVLPIGGKNDIGRALRDITKATGFSKVRWLGVVQDADESADVAWQRVRDALSRADLPVADRAWIPARIRRIETVVFILPDGTNPGDLETLILNSIAGSQHLTCVAHYFDCLSALHLPIPRQESKSRLHAYLAAQEPPHLRLGEAAQRGLFTLESAAFEKLVELLPS